ncbi:MAG: hypothetical protein WD749_12450 [Phycisphaerales bacterium]
MPCLLVLLAFFFPRVVLVILWLFTTYLHTAYQAWIWPVLGFFFLPYTTLAYAWAHNAGGGSLSGFPLIVVIIAVLLDLGVLGGGAASRKG